MLSNSCTVYQVVIILCLPSVYGQTIGPLNLCSDVSASAGSSGMIEYLQGESGKSCTLTLTGLASGSYVSIPGVNSSTTGQPCPSVIINSQSYCIKGTDYGQSVIIQPVNNQLNFTSTSETPKFTLHYYNQVAICNDVFNLPNEPSIDQLTGIATTSYEPTRRIEQSLCFIYIKNLPNPPVTVQFELLNSEGLTDEITVVGKGFDNTASPGSTLLVNAENQLLMGYSGGGSYNFNIRFQIVHCGDIPAISNTTNTTTDTPWLPDAKVTYECVDGWKLKSDTDSTIECIVNATIEIAVWSDHSNIQCIPVECELTAEYQNITNGEVTDKRYYYTQQLEYHCDVGYVRDQVVVNCTSNGTWSALSSCVLAASQSGSKDVAIGVGTTLAIIAVACVIVSVVYGCKKHRRKSTSHSEDYGDASAALNLSEPAAEVQPEL